VKKKRRRTSCFGGCVGEIHALGSSWLSEGLTISLAGAFSIVGFFVLALKEGFGMYLYFILSLYMKFPTIYILCHSHI
jgi:hypothetical protein